jgi:hypothetical protein
MVSTLFANPYVPTTIEMATCKTYCVMAADYLQALLSGSQLASEAQKLHDTLYGDFDAFALGLPVARTPPVVSADKVIG